MKRIINASHLDEIRQRKAEYQKEYDAWTARYEESERNLRKAEHDALQPAKDAVTDALSKFIDPLKLDIQVDFNWRLAREDYNNENYPIKIDIRSNQNHDEKLALSWEYEVTLNRIGQVEAETNSWSGMSATTTDQISSLKLTAECLDVLANMNWKSLLRASKPRMVDYYDKDDKQPSNPVTAEDEKQAVFDDIEGTDYAVRLLSTNDDDHWVSKNRYMKVLKQSGSQIYPEVFYETKDGKFVHTYIGDRKRKSSVSINPDDIIEITDADIQQ